MGEPTCRACRAGGWAKYCSQDPLPEGCMSVDPPEPDCSKRPLPKGCVSVDPPADEVSILPIDGFADEKPCKCKNGKKNCKKCKKPSAPEVCCMSMEPNCRACRAGGWAKYCSQDPLPEGCMSVLNLLADEKPCKCKNGKKK